MIYRISLVRNVVKDGFQKTVDHFWQLFKGLIFAFLIILLLIIVLAVANISSLHSFLTRFHDFLQCGIDVSCIQNTGKPLIAFLKSELLFTLSLFVIGIAKFYIMIGYLQYALRVYDTSRARLTDLFPSFRTIFYIWCAWIIYSIIGVLGLILLIIPGLYFMTRCILFAYFIVDQDAKIIESLKMSWHITQGYTLKVFILFLLAILLKMIGNATVIGMLFIFPFLYVTSASLYRTLNDRSILKKEQP